MALILEPTRVLLQSNDSQWYWLSLTNEGIIVPKVDTTPAAPPPGADPFAILTASGGQTYRLSLRSYTEGTLKVMPDFVISPVSETGLAAIPLILSAVNYDLKVLVDAGAPLPYIVLGPVGIAPTITLHPATSSYAVGDSITLTAGASGTAPITWQWRKGGINMPGETSSSLTIPSSVVADSGTYSAVATNPFGTATTNNATITVAGVAPVITQHPASGNYVVNTPITLAANATGTAPITWQWRKGGVDLSGQTSNTLHIASAVVSDAGVYTVVATNLYGSALSNPAAVAVTVPRAAQTTTGLPVIPGTFPPGYCWPADPQQFLNDIAALITVTLDTSGANYILSQPGAPSASQREFVWHNPDTGHILTWNVNTTRWEQPNPEPPGSLARRVYVGTPTQLKSYDGGDGGSNPMWEEDPLFAGRVAVAVGTLTGNAAVVAVGGTGGTNQVVLVKDNLPAVTIPVKTSIVGSSGVGAPESVVGTLNGSDALAGEGRVVDGTDTNVSGRYYTRGETLPLGIATPVSLMPAYFGVYYIKRTARTAYWS